MVAGFPPASRSVIGVQFTLGHAGTMTVPQAEGKPENSSSPSTAVSYPSRCSGKQFGNPNEVSNEPLDEMTFWRKFVHVANDVRKWLRHWSMRDSMIVLFDLLEGGSAC